ncbi:protein translocase subunit SecD [candidate division KSB1 bacterium]|nr:protein translocase subunit SecD [candidate division KSB1 bacterium]
MQRKNLVKTIIIFALLIWSVWNLYPTYKMQTLTAEEIEQLKLEGKYNDLEARAIKRGLDLQGGIYLLLEVDFAKLIENLAVRKDEQFEQILQVCKEEIRKDLTLDFFQVLKDEFADRNIPLNRYFFTRLDDDAKIITDLNIEADDAIDRTLQILRNRIDQFGVSEPNFQKRGDRRIIVELPGIQEIERAKQLIGKTAQLEFTMLLDSDIATNVLREIDNTVKKNRSDSTSNTSITSTPDSTDLASTDQDSASSRVIRAEDLFGTVNIQSDLATAANDTSTLNVNEEFFGKNPFLALLRDLRGQGGEVAVPEANRFAVEKILSLPEVQKVIPADAKFLWSDKPIKYQEDSFWQLYLVKKEPGLTGKYLTDANVQIGGGQSFQNAGQAVVQFEMNSEGARIFARLTGANINKRMAIVLDDNVYSAPVIRSKIRGSGVIEGIDEMKEAQEIAIVLRAGALPAPVQIIEERTVTASLGEDSIRKGTTSAIVGFVLVVIFMLIYYKLSGIVANIALLMNLVVIFAILAYFHATLTLPGVAGIILTIGMAVDSNVLIFERVREELRSGKTVRAAIDTGYAKALSAILDANVTTLISAAVLYQFGTGPIRGFALTLSIGILVSLFTSLIVTRVIFDFLTSKFSFKTLSI